MDYLNHITALAGLAVLIVQQILKMSFVPAGFANRHPVPTVIGLSVAAAIIVVLATPVVITVWYGWVLLVVTILLVATVTYNMTIKNWTALRAAEGPGDNKV